jgi:hypothetical protein
VEVSYCDEFDVGFGWTAENGVPRTSHALRVDGGVWLFDPVDVPEAIERALALGEPAGIVQVLDRHSRDSEALARRLGVPHHAVPFDGVPGAPFEVFPLVRRRVWAELAVWWPERRVLVCGDALGTLGYFVAPGERLGVHPLMRLFPPRSLGRLEPRHVLVGHGAGVHGDAAARALAAALATSRRRLPSALWSGLRRLAANRGRPA